MSSSNAPDRHAFPATERAAVYRVIEQRRDVRSYLPDAVPERVLRRILEAAHRAGSVGLMQPWNFLLLRDLQLRERIHAHFLQVNAQAAAQYEDSRRDRYMALKLQGILDAPLNLLVTCDTTRGGPHVLGRFTMPEMDVYSTCLAVQNLWLAARAEGVGVGWMSIMRPKVVGELLGIPEHVVPVAYLTLGYPVDMPDTPLLERVGWKQRAPLDGLVFDDRWGNPGTLAPVQRPGATAPLPAEQPIAAPSVPSESLARNADLSKPEGALGQLETLALQLCAIQGQEFPQVTHKWLLLTAGDHGVTAEGVSAYRPEVTAKMVYQFVAGSAAVCALARQNGVKLRVADLGVDHDFNLATGLAHHKVRRGTRNFAVEPAMTEEELSRALSAGASLVSELPDLEVLALGEMGIGNSSAAAAMVAALLGCSAEQAVGRGTGVGSQTLARKVQVVAEAVRLHTPEEPLEVLRCLGGYELAGLVGAIRAACRRRAMVVLDGYITGAAALVAARLWPEVLPYLVAGHQSAEPGHQLVLQALGLKPLLNLDMRLGEGSGAVLAIGLVEAAARSFREMCTFHEAGIEHPLAPGGKE